MKLLSLIERVWWYFNPYVEVTVRWPVGEIVVEYGDPRWYDCGARLVLIQSADPNDHYRPFLEEWIGRQRWDWQFLMKNNDARDNRITIRIRQKHAVFATHVAMMWN